MSILAGFGAAPSNLTVPLTLAAVAGSIGVAAGAAEEAGFEAAGFSSVGCLLQPERTATPTMSTKLQSAISGFLVMIFCTSQNLKNPSLQQTYFWPRRLVRLTEVTPRRAPVSEA